LNGGWGGGTKKKILKKTPVEEAPNQIKKTE